MVQPEIEDGMNQELGHLPKSGSNEQASGTMKICHGSLYLLEPVLEVEG